MVRSFWPNFSSKAEEHLLALCTNNPHQDRDTDKWNKAAVRFLVRKLNERPNILEELEKSVKNKDSKTKCVLLPKITDNRLLISHRRGKPQVIYGRLWRWPDLKSHHQIRAIPSCESRSPESSTGIEQTIRSPTVCVNPYHYDKTEPKDIDPILVSCPKIPPDLSTSHEDSDTTVGTRARPATGPYIFQSSVRSHVYAQLYYQLSHNRYSSVPSTSRPLEPTQQSEAAPSEVRATLDAIVNSSTSPSVVTSASSRLVSIPIGVVPEPDTMSKCPTKEQTPPMSEASMSTSDDKPTQTTAGTTQARPQDYNQPSFEFIDRILPQVATQPGDGDLSDLSEGYFQKAKDFNPSDKAGPSGVTDSARIPLLPLEHQGQEQQSQSQPHPTAQVSQPTQIQTLNYPQPQYPRPLYQQQPQHPHQLQHQLQQPQHQLQQPQHQLQQPQHQLQQPQHQLQQPQQQPQQQLQQPQQQPQQPQYPYQQQYQQFYPQPHHYQMYEPPQPIRYYPEHSGIHMQSPSAANPMQPSGSSYNAPYQSPMRPSSGGMGQSQSNVNRSTEVARPYQFRQNRYSNLARARHEFSNLDYHQNYDPHCIVNPPYQAPYSHHGAPVAQYQPSQYNPSQAQPMMSMHQPPASTTYSSQVTHHYAPEPQPISAASTTYTAMYAPHQQQQQQQPQQQILHYHQPTQPLPPPRVQHQGQQSEQMQLDHYQQGGMQIMRPQQPTYYESVPGPSHSMDHPMDQSPGIDVRAIPYREVPPWCSISYQEYETRVGEKYYPMSYVVSVDGYTQPMCADRFCLGGLSNINRNQFTEWVRRRIGKGFKITYVDGEVYVESRCEASVFVSSPLLFVEGEGGSLIEHVSKLSLGSSLKVFNIRNFAKMLSNAAPNGFEAVYKMTNCCLIRVSFVKGWGRQYKRTSIYNTPCWVEVQMNEPLERIDKVLRGMKGPSDCGSTS